MSSRKQQQEQANQLAITSQTRNLPYEIFLEIVDRCVDIAYAESSPGAITWIFDGSEDAFDQVYISSNPVFDRKVQQERFARFRNIYQVNQTTRRLVCQRFPRFPRYQDLVEFVSWKAGGPTPHAWVCPSIDVFIPNFDNMHYDEDGGRNLLQAVMLNPLPEAAKLLRHIQKICLNLERFMASSEREILALVSLRNLKVLRVWHSTTRPLPPADLHSHKELHHVDGDLFPTLAREVAKDPYRLTLRWKPLWDAGVRIILKKRWSSVYDDVELVYTPDGMRVKFLNPECTCYEDPEE